MALESNKIQVVADEIAKNPEREQKYLFSDESYFQAQSVIVVKKAERIYTLSRIWKARR